MVPSCRVRASAAAELRAKSAFRRASALLALSAFAWSGCANTGAVGTGTVPASAATPSEPGELAWDITSRKRAGSLEHSEPQLAKSLDDSLGDIPDDGAGGALPDEPDAPDALARKKRRHPTGTPEPKKTQQPSGERCLRELGAQGVHFRRVDARPGIETPVVVTGKLGKITYFAYGIDLLLDCRMALTLARIAPLFDKHGVTKVRFSGAYVYRLTRHGKLSLHANGLALDVHALTVGNQVLNVEKEFAHGLGCKGDLPLVNRIACDLRETSLFREVITPDYDADHKDHLHIAIPRLDSTPSVLSTDPAPAPAPRLKSARKKLAAAMSEPIAGSLPEALPEAPPAAPEPPVSDPAQSAEQSSAR